MASTMGPEAISSNECHVTARDPRVDRLDVPWQVWRAAGHFIANVKEYHVIESCIRLDGKHDGT
jgi:hypothetical protein